MKAEIDLKTVTCNAAFLAESFNVSTRNISYWIERGLPTHGSRKNRTRPYIQSAGCDSLGDWNAGLQKWEIPLPPPLATMLVGYGLDIGRFIFRVVRNGPQAGT